MKKPAPEPGLVIKYDYLWRDELTKGHRDGSKERPCAVVLAMPNDAAHRETKVLVCPITHSPPQKKNEAVRIPIKVGRYLGLDSEQSWIRTTEVNKVSWDDPGIIPAKPGQQWEYGRLPKALYEAMRDSLRKHGHAQQLSAIDRTSDDETA